MARARSTRAGSTSWSPASSALRLLVVGDVVLDEYLWGDVERVSPEAPVPVVHVQRESMVLGGAGNVVRNVIALGGALRLLHAVGDDRAGERVLELLAELGVDPPARCASRTGRRRARRASSRARSRSCASTARPTSRCPRARRARCSRRSIASRRALDGAIIEDYGKGTLSRAVVRARDAPLRRRRGVPVAVDPKERSLAVSRRVAA